eukprot:Skav212331  [mRNA]  locus=scaffold3374:227150:228984:- [translate_table: standard]
MALPRIDGMRKQVSLQDFRKMTGHTAVGGASPFALGHPRIETVKDLISSKSKGGIGAPWAEDRDRPIAGIDIAEKGGSYSSYSMLMDHRRKHARCPNSPGVMFDQTRGPPITSYDHGFYPANLRPPRQCRGPLYPISSTWISRSASELQKTMKSMGKGR